MARMGLVFGQKDSGNGKAIVDLPGFFYGLKKWNELIEVGC